MYGIIIVHCTRCQGSVSMTSRRPSMTPVLIFSKLVVCYFRMSMSISRLRSFLTPGTRLYLFGRPLWNSRAITLLEVFDWSKCTAGCFEVTRLRILKLQACSFVLTFYSALIQDKRYFSLANIKHQMRQCQQLKETNV